MKSFDLIVACGSKASDKSVFQLLSGKNQIGTNIKCSTQIDLQLIKPQHFELFVTKTGRISLIPLVSGLQIKNKCNNKLKELEPFQCYNLFLQQSFYIERTYSCYVNETATKKSSNKETIAPKTSLWLPKQKQQVLGISKKAKKQDIEQIIKQEELLSEDTQQKLDMRVDEEEDYNDSQTNEYYDFEDEEEEEEEEEQEVNFHHRKSKTKISSSSPSVDKKSKNNIYKEKNMKNNISSCETSLLEDDVKKGQSKKLNQLTQLKKISESKMKQESTKKLKEQRKQKATCRIILSNCEISDQQKKEMIGLGAIFIEDQEQEFDVVVMESFRRRAKLLVGLNKKASIVSKNWILDCIDDQELISEYSEYFIEVSKDDQEKFHGLDLDSVQLDQQNKNKDKKIFSECVFLISQDKYKNISNEDLQCIIKSGGGIISYGIAKSNKKCYSVIESDNISKSFKSQKGVTYVDLEFILLSSLKQNLQEQFILNP